MCQALLGNTVVTDIPVHRSSNRPHRVGGSCYGESKEEIWMSGGSPEGTSRRAKALGRDPASASVLKNHSGC